MKDYRISKEHIVAFIKDNYEQNYGAVITPIKLQKTLYFVFGYWILEELINGKTEENIEYLFNSKFEAWQYGPVDPDVYRNNTSEGDGSVIDKITSEFLVEKLDRIFKISDFTLVNLTHAHDCWKKNYDQSDIYHNTSITKEEIVSTFKQFIK